MQNSQVKNILKKNKAATFLAILSKVIFSIFIVMTSYYLSKLFDSYRLGSAEFKRSIIIMIAVLFATVLFSYISDYFNSRYIRKTNIDTRKMIDRSIILKSEELLSNKNTGKHLSWYVNDVDELESKYFVNIVDIFHYASLVIFSAVSIASLHWLILIATLVLLLISLAIPNLLSKYIYDAHVFDRLKFPEKSIRNSLKKA